MKNSFLLLAFLAFTCGCEQPKNKSANSKSNKAPATFAESYFDNITPLANGGAYVTNLDSGLWYLSGSEATKVKFPEKSLPDNGALVLEITPLLNGGAYAYSILDKTIWYLNGDTAVKVTETMSFSGKLQSSTGYYFPLYAVERKKRIDAEKNTAE